MVRSPPDRVVTFQSALGSFLSSFFSQLLYTVAAHTNMCGIAQRKMVLLLQLILCDILRYRILLSKGYSTSSFIA